MLQLIADKVEVDIANKGKYANTFSDLTGGIGFASPRIKASSKDYQLEGELSIPQASKLATRIRNYLRDGNTSHCSGLICSYPCGFSFSTGLEVIPLRERIPEILIQDEEILTTIEKALGEAISEIQDTSPSVSPFF